MVLVKKFHISLFLNLGTFGREKVIGDVPDRKLAFLDHVKKLQILHFFQRGLVHGFDEKFQIDLTFRFRQIWPINLVWRLSR